jgi:glycosyltransferase involved in cell wall biosynthesis
MKKICFISGSSPSFLGGVSIYQKNLIKFAKDQKLPVNFTWIYPGIKNRKYSLDKIEYIEIKSSKYPILKEFDFSKKVGNILKREHFDIINTHANWGHCLKKYSKKNKQTIIHTYHGVTHPYMKIQFKRFGFLRYLFHFTLPFFYFIEKPPIKKADKIICVSEKVKKQIEYLYGKRKNVSVIRTGVDLSIFGKISQKKARKDLKLDSEKVYGLYEGRGGYWNKGLDRAINISKKMYGLDKNFRLIVVGSDKKKCREYLNFPFVIYKGLISRKELPKYYSSANFFFSLSRYEGGAPTLALSEAIASGCLAICSKDSNMEIFKDKRDCLIIEKYGLIQAQKILDILKEKNKITKMNKSAKNKIKDLSLEKWGRKYFKKLNL